MSTVYLDTETTGLNPPKAEIVEITIIDDEGNSIIDTLVKPLNLTSWPQAQRIHHISPAMVADAPTLDDIAERIKEAVKGKTVVIYNAGYDTTFLPELLDSADSVECCMLRWSEHKGEWSDYRQSYKWFKLSDAAAEIGYQWEGEAHRALADTLATRAVWNYLNK